MRPVACLSLLIALSTPAAQADEREVTLLTLEWPPYTSATLPDQGVTSAVVRRAFEAAGYRVSIEFQPWKRAIETVAAAPGRPVAFFPGYHCRQKEGLIASESVGTSPLGFAQRAEAPLSWTTLDDLAGKRIGVVLGYANTPDFDARVADGRLRVEAVTDDAANLRKLVTRRLDAAVIDRYVLDYLRRKDPALGAAEERLDFNARPLQVNQLHVCALDGPVGRRMIRDFDAGLARIDAAKLIAEYFGRAP